VALSYTTGYRVTSDMYKYFIPLYIEGNIERVPVKYKVECEIKIGGITKKLNVDLVLIKDFVVAPEGTPIWGLINNSYV
jgi:hypothetical protein